MDVLLVDKTGTFTHGRPQVVEIVPFGKRSKEEVLRMAAVAEKYSEHPLARAVLAEAKASGVDPSDPEGFEIKTGKGVLAKWDGRELLVGKPLFLSEQGVSLGELENQAVQQQTEQGRTPVLVAEAGQAVGLVAIADGVRPEAHAAVESLRAGGVGRIVMLTGDNAQVARAVARQIGVDEVRADLLPEEKLQVVKEFQAAGHTVGMIGDGINDAPALAQAEVGIAMGGAGTDVAVETADVTLMNDDLSRLVQFMCMAGKVMTRIKLNIFFSMVYNVIGFALAGFGLLSPVVAVLFQEAGCITVVFSSTLLLWTRMESSGRPGAGMIDSGPAPAEQAPDLSVSPSPDYS
jgi:P-type E1-E2 ATPase